MRYYVGSVAFGATDISHHGILGMKWGVRRYQNSDGSLTEEGKSRYGYSDGTRVTAQQRHDALKNQKRLNELANSGQRPQELREAHTIPSGTKIYRTTASNSDNPNGPKYMSYIDADRDHYNGGWIRWNNDSKKAYEHQYTVTKDIKVPGREELKEVINKAVKENKLDKETANAWFDVAFPKGTWKRIEAFQADEYEGMSQLEKEKKFINDLLKNYKKMTPNEAYFFAAQTLGLNNKLKKAVIAELTKRGYNAMSDEASIGGQNGFGVEGVDPLIVFDSSVLSLERTKKISRRQERKAHIRDSRWSSRNRRNADW